MGEHRTKVWGVAAKVEACEPHRFCHSCATRLHELGWDIRDIQEFLGHADIKTTSPYAAVTPQRLVAAVKARPLTSGVLLGGSAPPPESAS